MEMMTVENPHLVWIPVLAALVVFVVAVGLAALAEASARTRAELDPQKAASVHAAAIAPAAHAVPAARAGRSAQPTEQVEAWGLDSFPASDPPQNW